MSELHLLARFVSPPLVDVDHEVAELEAVAHGLRRLETRTAEVRGHARHQLTEANRLADVVVSPDLQGDDDIDLVRARAHHDHGYDRIHLAQLSAHVEAGAVGQADLAQGAVRMGVLELANCVRGPVGFEHLVALRFAGDTDLPARRGVRVDDQDFARGIYSRSHAAANPNRFEGLLGDVAFQPANIGARLLFEGNQPGAGAG